MNIREGVWAASYGAVFAEKLQTGQSPADADRLARAVANAAVKAYDRQPVYFMNDAHGWPRGG